MQRSRIRSFDGTQIAVTMQGPADGDPILFSHHLGGVADAWVAQAEALSDRFRIIRYDARGHGASDAPAGPYDVAMLGRDALAVLGGCGLTSAHFVGLSLGGMVGIWLAANQPSWVDRLVLVNTAPFILNKSMWEELTARAIAKGMQGIAVQTLSDWLSNGFKVLYPDRLAQLIEFMHGMSPLGYAGNCAVLRDVDLRTDLERIQTPTLVIAGSEDGIRGAFAPVMARTIVGARLVTIPGAAHLSPIENPDAFNTALLEHLT